MNFVLKLSVSLLILQIVVASPPTTTTKLSKTTTTATTVSAANTRTPAITEQNNVTTNASSFMDGNFHEHVTLRKEENPLDEPPDSMDNYTYMIVGGYRPEHHSLAKYVVSIGNQGPSTYFGDRHLCGGSIIAPNIILTASHCFVGSFGEVKYTASELFVISGTPHRFHKTRHTQVVQVRELLLHPKFDPTLYKYDVAMLILEDELDINSHTQIISLSRKAPHKNTVCTVVGWGRIFENGPLAAELLYADVTVLSKSRCKGYDMYNPTIICASDRYDSEVDACAGDSGGPLICNNTVAGVVSFGIGCATPGYPGFYSAVHKFTKFLVYRDLSGAIKGKEASTTLYVFVTFVLLSCYMRI